MVPKTKFCMIRGRCIYTGQGTPGLSSEFSITDRRAIRWKRSSTATERTTLLCQRSVHRRRRFFYDDEVRGGSHVSIGRGQSGPAEAPCGPRRGRQPKLNFCYVGTTTKTDRSTRDFFIYIFYLFCKVIQPFQKFISFDHQMSWLTAVGV
jgi:hypothetical protein